MKGQTTMTTVTTMSEVINGKARYYGVLVILDSTTLRGTAVLSTRKTYALVDAALNAVKKLREDVGGCYRITGRLAIVVNSVNMLKGGVQ